MNDKLLRSDEVTKMVALSRSQIYRMMPKEEFPASIKVGPKSVRWRESEIRAWMENLKRT